MQLIDDLMHLYHMLSIVPATTEVDFKRIEQLAWEIMPYYYRHAAFPPEHTIYFLQTLQSVEALKKATAKDQFYYLLRWNDETVGYLGFQLKPEELYIGKLYLLERFRGNRIGAKAMKFTEGFARELDCKRITLLVHEKNPDGIRFYEHQGFAVTELKLNHFETGQVVRDFEMVKALSTS